MGISRISLYSKDIGTPSQNIFVGAFG